jgi:hypothetical protein
MDCPAHNRAAIDTREVKWMAEWERIQCANQDFKEEMQSLVKDELREFWDRLTRWTIRRGSLAPEGWNQQMLAIYEAKVYGLLSLWKKELPKMRPPEEVPYTQ